MSSPRFCLSFPRFFLTLFLSALILFLVGLVSGCGSGSPSVPRLSGNTQVTVVLTSTANDQLSEFDLEPQTLGLTSQSGTTVDLLSAPQDYEFIHLNGQIDPLITVSVPQGIYTSATATIGGAQFTCLALDSEGGLSSNTYAYGYTPNANVTVTLPAPITVTGNQMALSFDLLVSESATYSSCYNADGTYSYSITPTFTVTPATMLSTPTNPENGKILGLAGQVSAIDSAVNSFTLAQGGFGLQGMISVSTDNNTAYQGVSGFTALAVNTFVDLDAAIQPNGSLLATRIAVEDPSAVQVQIGPLMFSSDAEPALMLWGQQQQGTGTDVIGGQYFSYGNAAFQISGQLANLQALPFVPSFNGSNMVPGQNVYLTATTLTGSGGFPYTPANSVTLIPQTIDATVVGSSTSGNFTVYSVTLADYDLFPALAVQQGQNTLLTNPGEVEVYIDSDTQMLNTQTLAAGSTFRFYGLVFNDNGTLRMDCAQVNDGVAFSSPTAAQQSSLHPGTVQQSHREMPSRAHETIGLIKQQP